MKLPVVTAEYVAALAELGAAVLAERQLRAEMLQQVTTHDETAQRAAWRAQHVRVELAGDRLQKAATEAIWHREVERGKAMLAPLPAKYRPKKRAKK